MDYQKISIIICTYNRSKSLFRTLYSIINVVKDSNYEVIVVDNNSTDDTKCVVSCFSKFNLSTIRYCFESYQGKVAALNTGIRFSNGDILVFTDDDVLWNNDIISEIRDLLRTYHQCSVFGGRVVPVLPAGTKWPDWIHWQDPFNIAEGPLVDHDKGCIVRSYYEDGMCLPIGAMMVVRRNIFDRYGLYEETRMQSGELLPNEDSVWATKLKKAGETMLYVPSLTVEHVTDPKRLSKRYFRRHFWKAGKVSMFWNERIDDSNARRLLNVPRWVYRKLLYATYKYISAHINFESKSMRFARELDIVFLAAMIFSFLQSWRKDR